MKMKTYQITTYIRGIELQLVCVTTSKKKFSEITGISLSHVNGYSTSYDLRYPICNENPEKVFAKPGLGGEVCYIFNRGEIKPLNEYVELINQHREKYPTHRDYLENLKLDGKY